MSNPYKAAKKFIVEFGKAEYLLKRCGYIRRGRKVAEADWDVFADKLSAGFFEHVVATGKAKTLIGSPPRQLLSDLQWSPPAQVPLANVKELLVNGVCRVRNSYVHGEKFRGGPEGQLERDATLVAEARAVLSAVMSWVNQAPAKDCN